MRVLFAGTPEFSVPALQALLQEHEIIGVYTQPDRKSGRGKKLNASPVKQLAMQHKLTIHQPQSLRDQADIIKQLKPDVFVVVAFGMLLPQHILDIPPLGCINIHGSILPRWRGAAPIQRAIEAGDATTGVSIMQMEAGLDTGPVHQVLTSNISDQDNSQMLHDRLAILGAQGICETLMRLSKHLESNDLEQETGTTLQEKFTTSKQDDDLATYAHKINKVEAQINWSQSAEQIQRKIRAFNPWPICQTQHNDTRLRIWQSSVVANNDAAIDTAPTAGQIVQLQKEGIIVTCGESTTSLLQLEVLQRDGSKPLATNEFTNGYPITIGDILK